MRSLVFMLLVGFGAATLLTGCFEKPEPTCAYWVPKLSEPVKVDQALDKMEDLRCRGALPSLKTLYEQGQQRKRILRLLTLIRDKKGATPILKKAVLTRDLGKLAASIIEDWQLAAAAPELKQILQQDILPKNRAEALKALMSFSKGSDVRGLLIQLAAEDPNRQTLETNLLAVQHLGRLGDPAAVPAVLKAAFLRDNRGGSIYMAARLALAQIGGDAVVHALVELASGKNAVFQEFARKNGLQEWQWRYGPELVQMMSDTLDPRMGAALATNMTRELSPPMGIGQVMEERWKIAQMNRLRVAMLGIGHVGGDGSIAGLEKLIMDPRADTRSQRLGAATALALVGSEKAQEALLRRYAQEPKTSLTKLLAEAFRQPFLQPMTMGLDHRHIPAYLKLVKKPSDYVLEGLKAPQVGAYLGAAQACKGDTSCLLKMLSHEDKNMAVKAAVLLARSAGGDPAATRTALLEHLAGLPLMEIDRQRFSLIALTRIGDASTGEELLNLAKEVEDRSPAGKVWKMELQVFGHALKRRG